MSTTRFLVVRHALTDDVGNVLRGTMAGIHLNAQGRVQAARLAEQLQPIPLSAVVSSPLERAYETARPIAESHRLEIQQVQGLTEFDPGKWTGNSFAELNANPAWQRFNALRSLTRAPAGESMMEVQQRVVAALLALRLRYPDGSVALVSHGDPIRAALLFFLGMPIDFYSRIEISPASISVVDLGGDAVVVRQVNGQTFPAT